ncbi:MAG: protein kinase [Myxococcales bacterium]|nr:protein kinase [Myxococcales bacterium]
MTQISYQLTQKLREGEAYSTYRGMAFLPDGSQRSVVIKLLHPRLAHDNVLITHLTGFLDALRGLIHNSLAPIWDFGRAGDLFFLIREYIPGVSLEQLFGLAQQSKAAISPALAVYLAREISNSIHLIHKHRVPGDQPIFLFHGGLTPQNIILTRIGDVVITDTGLDVIFWRDDQIVNALRQRKQSYHPPEYLAGQRPMRRGDTYSIAALLYQMLTGVTPQQATYQWGGGQHFVPPSSQSQRATPELDQLLHHALYPQIEQRLVQVDGLLDALKNPALIRQQGLARREAMEYIEVLVREESMDPPALPEPLLFDYPFHIESLLPQREDLPPPHKRYRPPRFEDTDAFHPLQEMETDRYHPHLVEDKDLHTEEGGHNETVNAPMPKPPTQNLFVSPRALGGSPSSSIPIPPGLSPAATLDESLHYPKDPGAESTQPRAENVVNGAGQHAPATLVPPKEDEPIPLSEDALIEEPEEVLEAPDSGLIHEHDGDETSHHYTSVDVPPSIDEHTENKQAPHAPEGTVTLSIDDVEGYEGETIHRKKSPLRDLANLSPKTSQVVPLESKQPEVTTLQTHPLPSPTENTAIAVAPEAPPNATTEAIEVFEPIETLEPIEDDEEENYNESTVSVPLDQVQGFIAANHAARPAMAPVAPLDGSPQDDLSSVDVDTSPLESLAPPPQPNIDTSPSGIPDIQLPAHLLAGAQQRNSSDPQPTQHFAPPEPPSELAANMRPGQAILSQLEEGQERFGKFVLLGRVALGGMAEVFRARPLDPAHAHEIIAVKRILPDFSGDANFIEMFKDEARIAGALLHPNIVQIYELGEVDGLHFISMEYIDGIDLARVIKIRRALNMPIPMELAVTIGVGVCRALHYAHDEKDANGMPLNMIHRDVTPHNVLISRQGDVKLTDFGIAKASQNVAETAVGELKGKLSYMSPEQAAGYPLDKRSDLFQVGIMLYEILTLQKMFEGKSDHTLLAKIQNGDFPRLHTLLPNLPPAFEQIIMKALALNPNERYQDASELERDLLRLQSELLVPPPSYDLSPFVHEVVEQRDALLEQYAQARKQQSKHTFSVWDNAPAGTPSPEVQEPQESAQDESEEATPSRRGLIYALFALLFLIIAGGTAATFLFTASPPEGLLSVSTNPAGAAVRLDGNLIGMSPIEEQRIPFDKEMHILQIQKDGFEIATRRFQFADPSIPIQVAILLERKKPKKSPTK